MMPTHDYVVTLTAFLLGIGLIWPVCALRLRQLQHQLDTDALTGVSSRLAFYRQAPKLIHHARRQGQAVAVAVVDVNSFKPVNDTYGHAAGDRVLIHVASSLHQCLAGYGLVARLGGDEFAAVLAIPAQQDAYTWLQTQLTHTAHRINTTIAVHDHHVQTSVSIGVAVSQLADAIALSMLLHTADKAMYDAKTGPGLAVTAVDTTPVPLRPLHRPRDPS